MKFNKKKLTKKVKAVMNQDIIVSVAMVSIMINIFFFSGILLFTSTSRLDASLYEASRDNLCVENYVSNLERELEASSDPATTQALFEVMCQSGEFERYYSNAVEAYLDDTL